MPAQTEPRSGLFYGWNLGESGWKPGMDANLLRLGRFGFHLSVKDRDLAAPPGSPAAGDTYIVATAPTGSWAGHAGHVAIYDGAAWQFGTPRRGWTAYLEDEDVRVTYKTSAWAVETPSYTDEQVRDIIGAALTAGTGVSITVNDAGDTITLAIDTMSEAERVRDAIGTALVAGTGISITVNDAGDTITIENTAGGGGSYTDEQVRDVMGTTLVAGSNVTITVNDAGDTITIAASGAGYTDEQARDAIGAALVAGTGVSITVNDAGDTITIGSSLDKALVSLATAANSHSTSAWAKIPIDNVEFDTNSIWDATNKRFVPKKAGYYHVDMRVRRNTSSTLVAGLGKNGSLHRVLGPDAGSVYGTGGSILVYCNGTTDYLEPYCYSASAIAYTTGTVDTYMSVAGPF
jgi:hypothetical protein